MFDRTLNLQNAVNRYLDVAFTDLRYNRMSMREYEEAVSGGTLERWKFPEDSLRFDRANPDHPLNSKYTRIRLRAADFLRYVAAGAPDLITEQRLEELHEAALDCDAAVRLSIIQALGILGRSGSASVLDSLLAQERESKLVREAIGEAREGILGLLRPEKSRWIHDPTILAV